MFNSLASAPFHSGTKDERAAFFIAPERRFLTKEAGLRFLVNGITVTKTALTFASAENGATLLIEPGGGGQGLKAKTPRLPLHKEASAR